MDAQERLADLEAARQGNTDARGKLLDSFRPYIRVIVHALNNQRVQARVDDSDLIQDALLEAHRSFSGFDGSTVEELAAWLRQIVVRTTRRKLRDIEADQRDPAREEPVDDAVSHLADSGSSPSAQAIRHEEAVKMADALANIPYDMQQVLLGRHVDEKSHAEIALQLGKTEEAVRQLYVRALRRLRDLCRR